MSDHMYTVLLQLCRLALEQNTTMYGPITFEEIEIVMIKSEFHAYVL